ncbi:MAG: glycosyltransferase [Bacteroidales bacterium]|nr:glycosyltransferase [Bacteroidales bacterium]
MKFFSIITICKNNLEELKRTYNSIKSQSDDDYQWIVVDADSTDRTKDWLDNIAKANWISEPDKGIYDAMNKGISMSKERYMIFMNSGDCFATNNVLEISKNNIKKNNFPVFVFGDSIDVSEDDKEYYRKAKNYEKNRLGMITQHQAMFFNRDKIGDSKYSLDYPLAGDYAFISSIINNLHDKDLLYLDFPICKFSMGGTNEMQRFKAIKEDYRIRKNILQLPVIVCSFLYLLHYMHALIKKLNPSSRFIRHKSVSSNN